MDAQEADQILRDVSADSALSTLGYAVVDLLDRPAVERLVDHWHSLARTHPPVWDPTGMAATIRHPGLDRIAHGAILEEVAGPVDDLTVDRTCFMSTFLAKKPSSDELPAHLDWRLVDESSELTHGCWIALQDMEPRVGALGVVPGSHLRVDFDRTPERPGHEWTDALLRDGAHREVLPIRAGQAIVFDHRLAHFSEPNASEGVRLAANLGLSRPESAEEACDRLLAYMERGMKGIGSDPQIPELLETRPATEPPTSAAPSGAGRGQRPWRRVRDRLRGRGEPSWGS